MIGYRILLILVALVVISIFIGLLLAGFDIFRASLITFILVGLLVIIPAIIKGWRD